MGKVKKYIIVFVIFVLLMCFILVYFMFRKENNKLLNDGRDLLAYINTLDAGEYELKDGVVYTSSGSVTSDQYFFNGNGNILKDDFENVSFKINYNKNCVYKNPLGHVSVSNKCPDDVNITVEIVRNNDTVSFVSNIENLSYKLSKEEDFSGNWEASSGKNVILSSYNSGVNYIWFKDEEGHLSDAYKFNVECLESNGDPYDPETFYCKGAKVTIDDKKWLILNSKSDSATLMLADSLLDRLPMCTTEVSKYCFYTNNMDNSYKWSLSKVKDYLNNEFINELSSETRSKLVPNQICDVYSDTGCDEDKGCGGYLKEDIVRKKYKCDKYTSSLIRVITYEEYNDMYNNVKDMSKFKGNYWIMNAYGKNVASTVEEKGNVFVLENPTNKKEVRPVITISK